MSPTHFDVNLNLGVSFPERAVFEIRRVFFRSVGIEPWGTIAAIADGGGGGGGKDLRGRRIYVGGSKKSHHVQRESHQHELDNTI